MTSGVDAGATLLEAEGEVLLRQVHPDQYPKGKLSKVAFFPSPRDEGLLSTRRNRIGPQKAFEDWRDSGKETVGTWGVSVGEFVGVDVEAFDDSHLPGQPEGHASADFTAYERAQQIQKGRKLRAHAHDRGCLHRAEEEGDPEVVTGSEVPEETVVSAEDADGSDVAVTP